MRDLDLINDAIDLVGCTMDENDVIFLKIEVAPVHCFTIYKPLGECCSFICIMV